MGSWRLRSELNGDIGRRVAIKRSGQREAVFGRLQSERCGGTLHSREMKTMLYMEKYRVGERKSSWRCEGIERRLKEAAGKKCT